MYKISLEYSTLIKVICAIIITQHHFFQDVFQANNTISNNLPLFLFNQQLGYMGVAIFFFLSGYGLMESEKKKHLSLLDYCKRRLNKIYLPFLLITAIWLPIRYYISETTTNCKQFIYNILWGGGKMTLYGLLR